MMLDSTNDHNSNVNRDHNFIQWIRKHPEYQVWESFKKDLERNYQSKEEEIQRFHIFLENLLSFFIHNAKYERGDYTYTVGINLFTDKLPGEKICCSHTRTDVRCLVNDPNINSFKLWNSSYDDVHLWNYFKSTYKRTYGTIEEEEMRFRAFADKYLKIIFHNERFDAKETQFAMGIDKYSDLFPTELKSLRNMCIPESFIPMSNVPEPDISKILASIDWSSNEVISRFFPTSLPQNAQNEYNGPNRITPDINELRKELGSSHGQPMCEEHELYPHTDNPMASHISTKDDIIADEAYLLMALQNSPLKVTMNTNLTSFQHYKSGIYSDEKYDSSPERLDHTVFLVGYGEEDGTPYWLIRNNWDQDWGENGLMKIRRNFNVKFGFVSLPAPLS